MLTSQRTIAPPCALVSSLTFAIGCQGLSLNKIGLQLRKERLTPLRGGIWHPAQLAELLCGVEVGDREAAARRASELRAQGIQLRKIGVRLVVEGFQPKDGGIWLPSSVHAPVGERGASRPGRMTAQEERSGAARVVEPCTGGEVTRERVALQESSR